MLYGMRYMTTTLNFERIIIMLLGSKEHFAKIYDDIQKGKAKQAITEWLDECPTDAEIMHEFDGFYVIHVKKLEEDTA